MANLDKISVDGAVYNLVDSTSGYLTEHQDLSAYAKTADLTAYAKASSLSEYVKTADLPTALPNPQKLTFTGGASGSYDGQEAVSISIPSEGLSESKANDLYVRMVGGRMKLAGCEMCDSMDGVVDFSSPDAAYSDDTYIYAANISDKETAYVKAVVLTGTSAPEISLESKWSWRGGTVPAIEPGGMLVFCWIYDRGIATFIPGASS